METISKECTEKIDKLSKNIKNQLNDIRIKISDFKMDILGRMHDFTSTQINDNEYLQNTLKKLESDVKKIDFDDLTKSYNDTYEYEQRKRNEDMESHYKKVSTLEKDVRSFIHSNQNHNTEIPKEINNVKSGNSSENVITENINHSDSDDIDILFCFDSNRKFLNFRKLWTLKGSKRIRCSTITSLNKILSETNIKKLNYILISSGCNDLDTKEPGQLIEEIKNTINDINIKFPGIKIILSQITPRKDEIDRAVVEYNTLLVNLYEYEPNIFIVDHNNLRDENYSMLFDNKHIHRRAVPLFASNIKKALRKAYGISFEKPNFGCNR